MGLSVPPQVQDFILLLIELHDVLVSLLLQPVKVPLEGSLTVWHIRHSSHIFIISRLADGALCHNIQTVNDDVRQDSTQY